MNVLVTGGSGFIGSHVVDALLKAGHSVRIFDMRKPKWQRYQHEHLTYKTSAITVHEHGRYAESEVDYYKGSLTDFDEIRMALDDIDCVMHLGAIADIGMVERKPLHVHKMNVEGTIILLEAMRYSGVKWIVYASTVWVYNEHNNLYTASKVAAENYCMSYQNHFGIDYTILRYGIPYGPRHDRAVIYNFIQKAMKGEPITIEGDGSQGRYFLYVKDLANAHKLVLDYKKEIRNRVYCVDGKEFITLQGLATELEKHFPKVRIEYKESRAVDFEPEKSYNDDGFHWDTLWLQTTSFKDGLKETIEWYKSHI